MWNLVIIHQVAGRLMSMGSQEGLWGGQSMAMGSQEGLWGGGLALWNQSGQRVDGPGLEHSGPDRGPSITPRSSLGVTAGHGSSPDPDGSTLKPQAELGARRRLRWQTRGPPGSLAGLGDWRHRAHEVPHGMSTSPAPAGPSGASAALREPPSSPWPAP